MTLSVEISAVLKASQTGGNDFGTDRFGPRIEAALTLADGTGAGQADILFVDERTVADGANDNLDLFGALTDAFGATINAAELVAIFVINAPIGGTANTTDLTVGGATNPVEGFLGGTTPTIGPLKPGAFLMLAAGDAAGLGAVTDGTGDKLRITNGAGAAATYQVAIVARTA